MLNIGGLVEYPAGQGGILLCNLLFKETEEAPVNGVKKRTVLTTLLQNMKAPFAGKTVIMPGPTWPMRHWIFPNKPTSSAPRRGWFGDANSRSRTCPSATRRLPA